LLRKQQKEKANAAFNKKFGIDKLEKKSKENLQKKLDAMSPEEKASFDKENDKLTDDLLDLLGI